MRASGVAIETPETTSVWKDVKTAKKVTIVEDEQVHTPTDHHGVWTEVSTPMAVGTVDGFFSTPENQSESVVDENSVPLNPNSTSNTSFKDVLLMNPPNTPAVVELKPAEVSVCV